MARAGFQTLNLAVGSFDRRQLQRFRRPDVSRAHDRLLELGKKYGLDIVSYIIAGAPGQKVETSLQDLLRLERQNTIVGLSVFYPAPGSLDYQRAAALGILPSHLSLIRSSALPLSQATSRLETVTLLRLSRIINFIKSLKKDHLALPRPLSDFAVSAEAKRREKGIILLSRFFHDGVIRGITPDGEVYEHPTARDLTRDFLRQTGYGIRC